MISNTSTVSNAPFAHQQPQPPKMLSSPMTPKTPSSKLTMEKLERLAIARLQHTVNELQTQVDKDRTAVPPTRKVFHCVCDETALTASIPELKALVADKTITMIVPFSALDSLDRLKKGTDNTNVHARESIRFFDRVQTPAGRRQITGVRIQGPAEKYASWEEAARAAASRSPPGSPLLADNPEQEPPSRIKELLNCAIFHLDKLQKRDGGDQVFLVTNDVIVREWADVYNVPTISSTDVGRLVMREDIEFTERKRQYDYAANHSNNPRSPSSPSRGGRGGGARGGRGGGSGRRDSWSQQDDRGRNDMKPANNGYGGRGRNTSPPDFILRSPPRGVARGRGKLWEP